MVQKKRQSKRLTLRQQHKIAKKVKEHHKKLKKAAKKTNHKKSMFSKEKPIVPS
jgi:nuclear GTP-binding protein